MMICSKIKMNGTLSTLFHHTQERTVLSTLIWVWWCMTKELNANSLKGPQILIVEMVGSVTMAASASMALTKKANSVTLSVLTVAINMAKLVKIVLNIMKTSHSQRMLSSLIRLNGHLITFLIFSMGKKSDAETLVTTHTKCINISFSRSNQCTMNYLKEQDLLTPICQQIQKCGTSTTGLTTKLPKTLQAIPNTDSMT